MEHLNQQTGALREDSARVGIDTSAEQSEGAAALTAGSQSLGAVAGQVELEGAKPNRAEQVAALHKQVSGAVEALVDDGAWQRMLDVAARFHDYSFGNQILIATQFPDATRVAGYRAWQKLGRQVRKGERSIAILAPMTYVMEPDEQEADPNAKPTVIQRFKVARVFDPLSRDSSPWGADRLLAGYAPRLLSPASMLPGHQGESRASDDPMI